MLARLLSLWRVLLPMWWRGGRSTVPPSGGLPATPVFVVKLDPDSIRDAEPRSPLPILRPAYPTDQPEAKSLLPIVGPQPTAQTPLGPQSNYGHSDSRRSVSSEHPRVVILDRCATHSDPGPTEHGQQRNDQAKPWPQPGSQSQPRLKPHASPRAQAATPSQPAPQTRPVPQAQPAPQTRPVPQAQPAPQTQAATPCQPAPQAQPATPWHGAQPGSPTNSAPQTDATSPGYPATQALHAESAASWRTQEQEHAGTQAGGYSDPRVTSPEHLRSAGLDRCATGSDPGPTEHCQQRNDQAKPWPQPPAVPQWQPGPPAQAPVGAQNAHAPHPDGSPWHPQAHRMPSWHAAPQGQPIAASPRRNALGLDPGDAGGAPAGLHHCGCSKDLGGSWPDLVNEPEVATDQWPELLDDSALWTVSAPASDPQRIERLQREQEGLRWNG